MSQVAQHGGRSASPCNNQLDRQLPVSKWWLQGRSTFSHVVFCKSHCGSADHSAQPGPDGFRVAHGLMCWMLPCPSRLPVGRSLFYFTFNPSQFGDVGKKSVFLASVILVSAATEDGGLPDH